jgi:hypothetical protein
VLAEICLPPAFTLSLYFDPEDEGDMLLRYVGSLPTDLHDLMSQKAELFLTTAARMSDPARQGYVVVKMNRDILQKASLVYHNIHLKKLAKIMKK